MSGCPHTAEHPQPRAEITPEALHNLGVEVQIAGRPPISPAEQAEIERIKAITYEKIFIPFTNEFFQYLGGNGGSFKQILERTKPDGTNECQAHVWFNTLIHGIIDMRMAKENRSPETIEAIRTAQEYKNHVKWYNGREPSSNADFEEVADCLTFKLKRNLSLAYGEALIIMLACARSLAENGYSLDKIYEALPACYSTTAGKLARHSDDQELEYQKILFSKGEVKYEEEHHRHPEDFFDPILDGTIHMPSDRIEVRTTDADMLQLIIRLTDDERIKIRNTWHDGLQQCPAETQLDSYGRTLNETFWHMLASLCRATGAIERIYTSAQQRARQQTSAAHNRYLTLNQQSEPESFHVVADTVTYPIHIYRHAASIKKAGDFLIKYAGADFDQKTFDRIVRDEGYIFGIENARREIIACGALAIKGIGAYAKRSMVFESTTTVSDTPEAAFARWLVVRPSVSRRNIADPLIQAAIKLTQLANKDRLEAEVSFDHPQIIESLLRQGFLGVDLTGEKQGYGHLPTSIMLQRGELLHSGDPMLWTAKMTSPGPVESVALPRDSTDSNAISSLIEPLLLDRLITSSGKKAIKDETGRLCVRAKLNQAMQHPPIKHTP